MSKHTLARKALFAAVGTLLLLSGIFFTEYNHYIGALVLVMGSAILYFVTVFLASDRDYLDICAVFTLIWLMTIGLSQLWLLKYQEPWISKTWVCVALAYAAFQAGGMTGQYWGIRCTAGKGERRKPRRGIFHIAQNNKRLYLCCTIGTLIGLACFCINIGIRGYVPFFSSSSTAYVDFYTRFHVFATAGTMLSGPCYYCAKACDLKKYQKAILYLCILYNTFAFPILVVSRGTFIVAAISLSCAIYYLNRKSLWLLLASLVVMFAVYGLCSVARNYTEAQLNALFQPAEITISSSGSEIDVLEGDSNGSLTADDLQTSGEDGITFSLSGQEAFLYSYLTVSHDNFNQAVKYSQSYTYGLRQLRPFNVILRSSYIEETLDNAEEYLVRPYLNTVNLIGDAYYDFHTIGVILLPFLWALAFGIIQGAYLTTNSPYLLQALGNIVAVVMLSFFSGWMGVFSTWMHWGVALLFFLISGISVSRNKDTQEEQTQ